MLIKRYKGFLYTWGDAYHTVLGHNDQYARYKPHKIKHQTREPGYHFNAQITALNYRKIHTKLETRFIKVATGPYHTAAISDDYRVYSFGETEYAKLGHKHLNNWLPTKIALLSGQRVVDVACGLDFTVTLNAQGGVYAWGYGGEHKSFIYSIFRGDRPGALGQGNENNLSIPTPISILNGKGVIQIAAGNCHAMALTQDGEVWVWGSNEFGALGAGQDTDRELIPVKLELPPCKYISASAEHSVALSNDNKLYAWGKNTALQLGPDLDKIFWEPITLDTSVTQVAAGEQTIMTKKFDGSIQNRGAGVMLVEDKEVGEAVQLCCGDEHFAYVNSKGQVYHLGGLFQDPNPNSLAFLKDKGTEMKMSNVFPHRVLNLFGSYSYFSAILAN